MLIRRETLAAALPALTSDDTRYFLSKVQIAPNGEVRATDGYIAVIAKDLHRLPDEDFPLVSGAPYHGDPIAPILLDGTIAKRLIAATPKGKRAQLPALRAIQISQNGSERTHTFAATDLTVPMVATVDTDPAENFPGLDRVMPKADKPDTIPMVLSSEVLSHLLQVAKAIQGNKGMQTIRFDVPTDVREGVNCAIRVSMTGDETEVVAAVMPCRI